MEQVYRVDGRVQCGQPHAFAVTVPEVSETDQYDADTLGHVDPLDTLGTTHSASRSAKFLNFMNAPKRTMKVVMLVLENTTHTVNGVMFPASHRTAQAVRFTIALTMIAAFAQVAFPIGESAG